MSETIVPDHAIEVMKKSKTLSEFVDNYHLPEANDISETSTRNRNQNYQSPKSKALALQELAEYAELNKQTFNKTG